MARRAAAWLSLGALSVAACANVWGFADLQVGEGAAGDAAAVDSGADSTTDTGTGDSGIRQDHYAPCSGLSGGYCGNNGLNGYAGSPNDLVHCVAGAIASVTYCDGGCLHVISPLPDACNPCVGVSNGIYCGRDLAGFPAMNADLLIQCLNSAAAQQTLCMSGCQSNGTTSACL